MIQKVHFYCILINLLVLGATSQFDEFIYFEYAFRMYCSFEHSFLFVKIIGK